MTGEETDEVVAGRSDTTEDYDERGLSGASLYERLWKRVTFSGPDRCWVWTGKRTPKGYGLIKHRGASLCVHRVAWAFANGKQVPRSAVVAHTCGNRPCVNPAHLALAAEGGDLRGVRPKGPHYNSRKSRCPRGHSYDDPSNLYVDKRGRRSCRACSRTNSRERWRRNHPAATRRAVRTEARADRPDQRSRKTHCVRGRG